MEENRKKGREVGEGRKIVWHHTEKNEFVLDLVSAEGELLAFPTLVVLKRWPHKRRTY